MDETELLRRLTERDPAALELFFEQYVPSVWRFVCTRVDGDIHLAEDLVNETMVALLHSLDQQPAVRIESLGGRLHSVVKRKVQDHYRAAARVRHLVEAVEEKTVREQQAKQVGDNPLNQQMQSERRVEIRAVMDSLPNQQRMVLEWKYIEGIQVREIAERLGATTKAAEALLFRSRNAFRERVGRNEVLADLDPVPVVPASNRNSALAGEVAGQHPTREEQRSRHDSLHQERRVLPIAWLQRGFHDGGFCEGQGE